VGFVQVPRQKNLFPNERAGESASGRIFAQGEEGFEKTLRDILEMFPILKEGQKQLAGFSLAGNSRCAHRQRLMAKPSF
jgi:ABC-type branched-subunit amino acid transport system ATPase component